MGVLAQVEMATNSFGNRNFMQPMRGLRVHLKVGESVG
jgi:hypothetical protein